MTMDLLLWESPRGTSVNIWLKINNGEKWRFKFPLYGPMHVSENEQKKKKMVKNQGKRKF